MPTGNLRLGLVLLIAFTGICGVPSAYARDCEIVAHTAAIGGGNVHYSRAGSGPAVILLHGLFAQKEQWNRLACALAGAGYSAIAPDLPGYGQSTGFGLADYRLEAQVGHLNEFADALGVASFDVAGNSMGGALAVLYARTHRGRVRTLALIGAPLGVVNWGNAIRDAIVDGVNPFIPLDGAQFDLEMRLLFVTPPLVPDAVRETMVGEYNRNNRHYTQVWNIVNLYVNALRDGRRPSVPTLALWGTQDKVFPIAGATVIRRSLPAAAFVPLADGGHLPHVEIPDRVAAIYLRFLARHRGRRAPGAPIPANR